MWPIERHSLCLHKWRNPSIPYFVSASTEITNKVRLCPFYLYNQYRYSHPITGLDGPLGLQEVEVPRISRQSTHEGGKVVSPTHRPPLSARRYALYSFMLEAQSTPGPYCCRKDCQWKISRTQLGSEAATFRAVAQGLNKLSYGGSPHSQPIHDWNRHDPPEMKQQKRVLNKLYVAPVRGRKASCVLSLVSIRRWMVLITISFCRL